MSIEDIGYLQFAIVVTGCGIFIIYQLIKMIVDIKNYKPPEYVKLRLKQCDYDIIASLANQKGDKEKARTFENLSDQVDKKAISAMQMEDPELYERVQLQNKLLEDGDYE